MAKRSWMTVTVIVDFDGVIDVTKHKVLTRPERKSSPGWTTQYMRDRLADIVGDYVAEADDSFKERS